MKDTSRRAFTPLEKVYPVREQNSLRGFTIIEIIIVIVILGIIAIVAIPKFISFKKEAEQAAEDATIGAVQSGIYISIAAEEVKK